MHDITFYTIKKYSEVSKSYVTLIDNYNDFTKRRISVQRIDFLPVYRVHSEPVKRSNDMSDKEWFFMRNDLAMTLFSRLMGEKEFLF